MHELSENRLLTARFENDLDHAATAAVNFVGSSMAGEPRAITFTAPLEPIVRGAWSCDMVEGGLGI